MINLVPGDSFRLIQEVPDQSVNLVMTDVPYPDMKIHDGTRDIISSANWIEWFAPMATQIKRVLTPDGSFVTTINSKKDRGIFFEWVYWMRQVLGFNYVLTCYWVKKNIIPGSVKRMRFPRDGVDFIAWFSVTPQYYSNLSAVSDWKSYNPATTMPTNLIYASMMDDVEYWAAKKKTGISHTGKYPEAVPRLFIQILTRPGDLVLDPFSGTGTTALAAAKYSRNCLAFEKNASNVRLTCAVFSQHRRLVGVRAERLNVSSIRAWKLSKLF